MTRPHILVVDGDAAVRDALVADLAPLVDGAAELVPASSGEEALDVAHELVGAGVAIPVVFIERTLPAMSGADLALAMQHDPVLGLSRRVLVTSGASLSDVDAALTAGAVHGMVTRPWSALALADQLRAQLATYHTEHDPDGLDLYGDLVDQTARDRARQRIAQQRDAPALRGAGDGGTRHALLAPMVDQAELERRFVTALDAALGHPPRLRVSAGSVLLEQGAHVGGIYVVLDGQVQLIRHADGGHRIVHESAAGPIVGLLSLATQRRSFLEVRATTEVRALPLTLGQLDRAMDAAPEVGALLTRVLVNALAHRLREADELQVRVDALAASLATERDQLAEALSALEDAQAALISNARLATLGELAAGIAHELNNPTAAIGRAVAHVADDTRRLLADDVVRDAVSSAMSRPPIPSAVARAARRTLTEHVGDRELADRLVDAGVTDIDELAALSPLDDARLDRLRAAHQLGNGLRNIATASDRIGDLVDSLRAYLRGGEASPFVDGVAIAETVEDALRLLGHRLVSASVTRRYEPVPAITARPGPLQQVWTNLVANALDAAGPEAHLEVDVDAPDPGHVQVRVVDDGPGVPADVVERLFEPHFTTKHGRVRFGSGLGLSICRQIVHEHGGTIGVESSPGRTVVRVVLPVHPGPGVVVGGAPGDGEGSRS